jgi:predicted secreted protein
MADRKQSKRQPRAATRPSTGPSLSIAWAAAIFALLTILFFHETIVGGKTFVSPDATQPAGFVRMGEQALFHDHVYPLWNPFVFLGMPSFASGAYNPLIYPPDWPLAIAKFLPLPDLTWLLIYYFLAGFFFFLLARDWGARPEGALLGAVAFVFAPNLVAVGSHGHGSQLVDSAYLPLMLWLASRWLDRGRLSDLAWLALAGGFQLLRGHVQICFYTWIAVAGYGLVSWIAAFRSPGALGGRTLRLAGLAVAAALAFGLAGFYNLPLRDYARYSIRGGSDAGGGVGMDYATQWSLAPYELPSVIVPAWTGFGGATYWGGMPFTDYPNAYVGVIAILLLVPAFLANGARRVFALAMGLLSLAIAFGRHFFLYGFLYEHLPLFNKFRIPVMVIVLFQLAVALGLAWGWTEVLERARKTPEDRRRLERLLLALGAVAAAALLVGVLGQDAWRSRYVALATAKKSTSQQPYSAEAAAFAYRAFIGDLGKAAILALIAVGAAWMAVRARLSAAIASALVLVLMLIELWPVSARVMAPVIGDPVQRNLETGRDDVVDFLEKVGPPGSFRVLPMDEILSNRYAGFAISSISGYHAAKPRLFQDLVDAGLLWQAGGGGQGFNLGWLRLLNVRYVIMPERLPTPPLYLREVYSGTRVVYENLLSLPRATVIGRYHVVRPAAAIIDSIRNGTSESSEITFLEEDPKLMLGPVDGATTTIVRYGLNDVTIDVDTPGAGLLRLADLWYPDWVATVDGRPARIHRADYALRAVPVPPGRHRVEFHYRSPALRQGLTLSLASLGIILLLFGVSWMRRERAVRPAAEPASAGAR